jgi:N-acetylmuramoyl-L-alanine amidase
MTMIWNPSPNFGERSLPITMLVLHYTGMQSGAAAIDWLANPASKVSAHYVVDEDGQLVHMVREEQRAQHAGLSYWRGVTDCNSASIGIEIVNPGHEFGYRPFPEAQMDTVTRLVAGIVGTYGIDPRNVVGHVRKIRANCLTGNVWQSLGLLFRVRGKSWLIPVGRTLRFFWR